jgi:hypothetical protein
MPGALKIRFGGIHADDLGPASGGGKREHTRPATDVQHLITWTNTCKVQERFG